MILYWNLSPKIYTDLYTRPFTSQNLTSKHTQNHNVTSVGQMQCKINCVIQLIGKKRNGITTSLLWQQS